MGGGRRCASHQVSLGQGSFLPWAGASFPFRDASGPKGRRAHCVKRNRSWLLQFVRRKQVQCSRTMQVFGNWPRWGRAVRAGSGRRMPSGRPGESGCKSPAIPVTVTSQNPDAFYAPCGQVGVPPVEAFGPGRKASVCPDPPRAARMGAAHSSPQRRSPCSSHSLWLSG